ncbi:MAG: tRNA pseudouridine55 synthase [Actinomycetota bacterium]|nr:tRNA pseudouridine synthase [Glaciihabitans sp.]MDQ1543264.1 tRNA pseudouridine55 synthase [Actinomycetota bacterium]
MTSGILLVDKPGGITSHDVVSRVRKLAGTRKVGHAGTLDPMATGLLVLGIDSSTRLLTYLVGLDKEYFATIRLGFATTTDDAEGEPTGPVTEKIDFTQEQIAAAIRPLTGAIEQIPSSVSAIKVDGRRSYDRVREGEEVVLKARAVTVSAFEVLERRGAELDVRVECTSGTYIRALARDLGAGLGVGGHLTALRRSRVGPFDVSDAGQLGEGLMQSLLTPASVAQRLFASVTVSTDEVLALSQGKRVRLEHVADDSTAPVAAIGPDGRLVGLVTLSDGVARVLVNFPTGELIAPC